MPNPQAGKMGTTVIPILPVGALGTHRNLSFAEKFSAAVSEASSIGAAQCNLSRNPAP